MRVTAYLAYLEINDSEIDFLFQSHLAVSPLKGGVRI